MKQSNSLTNSLLALGCIALSSTYAADVAIAQSSPAIAKVPGLSKAKARDLWLSALWTRLNPSSAATPTTRGSLPSGVQLFEAGQLGLGLQVGSSGIDLVSLYDLGSQQELAAVRSMPLFVIKVNPQDLSKESTWDAKSGWTSTSLRRIKNGFEITLSRTDAGATPFVVLLSAKADHKTSAWKWDLKIENTGSRWSVNEVLCPQVSLSDLGAASKAFVPKGAGKLFNNPTEQKVAWNDTYGNGSCTMQWMALYREGARPTGLYVGRHDPEAVLKGMHLNANAELGGTQIHFNQPAENPMSRGNGFKFSGEGVWQLLRGDWYDGAQTYKHWAQNNAAWWPKLTNEGRADTPLWYRELDVWTTLVGSAAEVQAPMQEFQKRMGVPAAVHWVVWETSGFDNDYPHYFPAKPGFRESVATLQSEQVHVVPHINGRLWDTRDKGITDFEYSSKALPWTVKVMKDGKLTPLTENYFGKEADGSDIYLAAMCPTARMWQDTLAGVTRQLTTQFGVDGIYMDQVGAVGPAPCMDPRHGHPLGGGGWWRKGYEELVTKVRRANRPGTVLTTECNAEQVANVFDGFLTLHWQENGQVPAFPAVYGGAIQMYGRLYNSPESLDLRMKAGQQLMYGEQIGWVRDDLKMEKVGDLARTYFENVVRTRNKIHQYFYAGEMARPPKLEGTIPTVTADWKYGSGAITTDAVLTSAWKRRGQNKMLFLFTNVGDQKIDSSFRLDPSSYGIVGQKYNLKRWLGPAGAAETSTASGHKLLPLSLPPASILVYEVSWK